jgi:hypothetical protein
MPSGVQTHVRFPLDVERAFGHDSVMSRTRVRVDRIVALWLVAGAVVWVAGAGLRARATEDRGRLRPVAAKRVVVSSGDTLWSIASRSAPGEDPRDVVDRIVDANGVDPGDIRPGEVILVPAPLGG